MTYRRYLHDITAGLSREQTQWVDFRSFRLESFDVDWCYPKPMVARPTISPLLSHNLSHIIASTIMPPTRRSMLLTPRRNRMSRSNQSPTYRTTKSPTTRTPHTPHTPHTNQASVSPRRRLFPPPSSPSDLDSQQAIGRSQETQRYASELEEQARRPAARGNTGNIGGNGARTRADEDLGSEGPDEEGEFRGSRTVVLEVRPFYAVGYC